MIKYIRGYAKNISEEHRALVIELSNCRYNCDKCKNKSRATEDGQPLTIKELNTAIDMFKRTIDLICFVGGEHEQVEIKELCKYTHKYGLKTCLSINFDDPSLLNKALVDELDYIMIGRCDSERKLFKKDYCPFADVNDWIEV